MEETNLQLWNVIGTWVASIGTVSAVITSLWFSRQQNRIRLKISAGARMVFTPGSEHQPMYCIINVVNIGDRPAKITGISWQFGRFKNKKYMLQVFGLPEFADTPHTLQLGEEATFGVPFRYKGDEDDWIIRLPRDIAKHSESYLKTIKIVVNTSVGQVFKRKIEENLQNEIINSYNDNK